MPPVPDNLGWSSVPAICNHSCLKRANERIIETAKGHEWSRLSAFQEFDGTKNAIVLFALECPNGNLSMLLVRDPFELLDSKSVEHWESLPVDAAQGWTTFLRKAKWEVFGKESKK